MFSSVFQRKSNGNVLVLVFAAFWVVAVAALIAYSYCGVFFASNRLQAFADEVALKAAQKLNDRDRIGQLNNMTARCRQLYYSTNEDYEKTRKDYPDLESFAKPLLDESRESALTLDAERKRVLQLAQSDADTAAQQQFKAMRSQFELTLPWIKTGRPTIQPIKFGKVKEVESNVEELPHFDKLVQKDRSEDAVARWPKMSVYRAERDFKVPGSEALSFKLSSLPAPVEKSIAPGRLVLPDKFEKVKPDYFPSATQVHIEMTVATGLGAGASTQLSATGTASTTGGRVQP